MQIGLGNDVETCFLVFKEMSLELRDVEGYESLFSISPEGRIWSKRSNKFLKVNPINGYAGHVTKIGGRNGKTLSLKCHIIVANAYIPNPENKPCVNHKDGNKMNPHKDNLEWVTHSENTIHAMNSGLLVHKSGCDNSLSKLTDCEIKYIRENYKPRCKTYGCRALAKRFDVSHPIISRVVNNKSYID